MDISRRDLLKMVGLTAVSAAVGTFGQKVEAAKKIQVQLKFRKRQLSVAKMSLVRIIKVQRRKFISRKNLTQTA